MLVAPFNTFWHFVEEFQILLPECEELPTGQKPPPFMIPTPAREPLLAQTTSTYPPPLHTPLPPPIKLESQNRICCWLIDLVDLSRLPRLRLPSLAQLPPICISPSLTTSKQPAALKVEPDPLPRKENHRHKRKRDSSSSEFSLGYLQCEELKRVPLSTAPLSKFIEQAFPMCPGDFHDTDAFPKAGSQQPTLIKGQTNRIIIYRGCFSPPHLGHLRILTHAFLRGGRDLNAIAAIVFPVDGKGRPATVKSSLKTLTFTKTERVALWKHDERTPAWAWVYGGSEEELESVMCCLPLLAGKEGYQLEFIALVGPDRAAWKEDPWTPYVGAMTFQDKYGEWIGINCKGCETTLICDAAREATEFDINGRLKRFKGCTPWGLLRLDIDVLKEAEKLKSEAFIATLEVKKPNKWKGVVGDTEYKAALETNSSDTGEESINDTKSGAFLETDLSDGLAKYADGAQGSKAAAIGEIAKLAITKALLDSQHIIICEAKRDRSIKRRFVRLDRSAPDFEETLISATILRQALRIQEAERLRESVEAMALSPELLLTMAGISGPDQDIAMIDPPCTETLENADDGKSKELLTSDGSGEDGKVGAESCKMDVYDTKGLPDGFYFDQSG